MRAALYLIDDGLAGSARSPTGTRSSQYEIPMGAERLENIYQHYPAGPANTLRAPRSSSHRYLLYGIAQRPPPNRRLRMLDGVV